MLFLLLLCSLQCADTSLSRFIYWSTQHSYKSGVPTSPVTLIPNAVFCNTPTTAVFSLHTVFEGQVHSFGITACDDDRIYIGLRISGGVLTYMEFESFDDFDAFMR